MLFRLRQNCRCLHKAFGFALAGVRSPTIGASKSALLQEILFGGADMRVLLCLGLVVQLIVAQVLMPLACLAQSAPTSNLDLSAVHQSVPAEQLFTPGGPDSVLIQQADSHELMPVALPLPLSSRLLTDNVSPS